MSNLQEFLRAAQTETEEQRFQRAYDQGLIPPEELIGRVRLVGDPRSPCRLTSGHCRTGSTTTAIGKSTMTKSTSRLRLCPELALTFVMPAAEAMPPMGLGRPRVGLAEYF